MSIVKIFAYYFCAIALTFCLLTYSPYDPSWWYVTTESQTILNAGGVYGAQLAAFLVTLLGSMAWGTPLLIAVSGWCYYKDYDEQVTARHLLAVTGIMLLGTVVCIEYGLNLAYYGTGGLMGSGLLKLMTYLVGPYGVPLLLWLLLTTLMVWWLGTSWAQRPIAVVLRYALMLRNYAMTWRVQVKREPVREVRFTEKNSDPVEEDAEPHNQPAHQQNYTKPTHLLKRHKENKVQAADLAATYEPQARVLEDKLARFGIKGKVTSIVVGPLLVLYEYQPDSSVPLAKILAREYDLVLALRIVGMRILAPIPGKSVVGFECPRDERVIVHFADHLAAVETAAQKLRLPLLLGLTTTGNPHVVDLASLPHLLVAGTTGSGKSVLLHSMIMSLLCEMAPERVRLVLIDPKRLEFSWYEHIPHLLVPLINDARQAIEMLRWLVKEMERRYDAMARVGARDIEDYNVRDGDSLSYIVVVIDEWADLMMTGGRDVEGFVVRLAQMARAAGIHLILATQRPSVDVITGLIKVNIAARIACRVVSKVDSRTILDGAGAEKLLGRGDMLWMASGAPLQRLHGLYLASEEIQEVATYLRSQTVCSYVDVAEQRSADDGGMPHEDRALYDEIVAYLQTVDEVSISLLQRKFRIGYNRSARMIDYLETRGMLLSLEGSKMKKVLH